MKSKFMKFIYIALGFLFVGLGALGVILPILPTTPFLLLASYFFAKGSDRFYNWFISTKLYTNHLEEFIITRAMTLKKKLCILIPVSTLLIVAAILVGNTYARIGISLVMALKYYYFYAHIDTINQNEIDKMYEKIINEKNANANYE